MANYRDRYEADNFCEVELECYMHKDTPKSKDFFKARDQEKNEYVGNFPVPPDGRFKIWWAPKFYEGKPQRSVRRMIPVDEQTAISLVLAGNYIRGIGPDIAKNAWLKWGAQFIGVMNACRDEIPFVDKNGISHDPFVALQKVKGIGPKNSRKIIAQWVFVDEYLIGKAIKDVMLGITRSQSQKLEEEFGENYHDIIEENPYALIVILNFKECDAIGEAQGVEKDDPRRIEGASQYALLQSMSSGNRNGDMYTTYADALIHLNETLGLTGNKRILEFPVTDVVKVYPDGFITTRDRHVVEHNLAYEVASRVSQLPSEKISRVWRSVNPQDYCEFQLDPEQERAIRLVGEKKLVITTGGPGTGKTSAFVNTVLKIAERNGLSVCMSAPTGKAAVVMEEATGGNAETNHMTFMLFERNIQDTSFLDYVDIFIIDEMSMTESYHAGLILERIPDDAHVIMVGDPWQLPPVGNGEPLLQMLESNYVPSVELKTIHRQKEGNGLVQAIHSIKNGIQPVANDDFDFVRIRHENMQATILKRLDWYANKGIDTRDIMIITPTNEIRKELNAWLQGRYALPGEEITPDQRFYGTDKVMHLKNNRSLKVMNGQVGYVCGIDESEMKVDYGGKTGIVTYPYADETYREHLVLAWAVTVHKSQGDQSKYVIAYFPYVENFIVRQLMYVAASRARVRASIYYSTDPMNYIGNQKMMRRRSFLSKFINEIASK